MGLRIGRQELPVESYVKTDDGWHLAVYRYSHPRSTKTPIVLLHGLGTNRFDVDFIDDRFSLAQYLYRKGYDVWFFECRGAGKSHRPGVLQAWKDRFQPNWIVDDIVFTDIPAIVKYVQAVTGRNKLHWLRPRL